MHYNNVLAMREQDIDKKEAKIEIMHHKIAMNIKREKLEKLTEADTDTVETSHKAYWIDIAIVVIATIAIGVTASIIRKQTKKKCKRDRTKNSKPRKR